MSTPPVPRVDPLMPPHPGEGRMRGADAFVDTLIRLGARDAFNVIGLGMYPLGDAFHRRRDEIRYISHVNETNLALAAQGYARERRAPACAVVYYSSGTSLALIALSVAWADRAPLVLVSTTNSRQASGRDPYAAVPRSILELGAQYAKWSYEVPSAERIPEALARAFAIAAQPPLGPVHLAVPADLWGAVLDGEPARFDFDRTTFATYSAADSMGVQRAAATLAAAERPVIIYGSEVGQLDAVPAAVRLAETLDAPVLLEDQPSYLAFPSTHPNYAGRLRGSRDVLAAADAVLSVGVEYTSIGLGPDIPPWPAGARVIALSVDPTLNVRHAWPDLALSGHPAASLDALERALRERVAAVERRHEGAAAGRAQRLARERDVRAALATTPELAPAHLIDVASRHFSSGEWIVVEALTSAVKHFDLLFPLDDPSRYHGLSGKASAQGWGAPTAIGVQLARPDRRVACLIGDGNLMFSATSLLLAGQLRLPIVFVVVDNGGWAHVRGPMSSDDYDDATLHAMGWLFDVDYLALAGAFGLRATRVSDAASLDRALTAAVATQEPWLIDAVTRGVDP